MPVEQGNKGQSAGYVGNKRVIAGYIGDKQVFGGGGNITVSGTINDSGVSNGNATDTYSVTCTSGTNASMTFYIGPDENYQLPSTIGSVGFSGLNFWSASDFTCSQSGSQIACTGTKACPSSDTVDNFSVTYSGMVAEAATYTCDSWNGFLGINKSGVISITLYGNAQSITITSSNFSSISGCTGQTRTVNYTVQVPNDSSAWNNANSYISCSKQVFQPASGVNFGISSWTGSVTYDHTGTGSNATISNDSNFTVTSSGVPNTSSWSGCKSTTKNVNITGTVSSSYCNSGTRTFNYNATQTGNGTYFNASPSITIAVDGTITLDADGLTNTSLSPSKFASRAKNCGSIGRCTTLTGTVPAGNCDSGTSTWTLCATQPGGNDDYQSSDYDGSASVNASGFITVGHGSEYFVNSFTPTSFSANNTCKSIPRTIIVTGDVSEDSDHCNKGYTDVKITLVRNQPTIYSAFSFPCSSVSVNANGVISHPSYATPNPSGFSKVKTDTSRTITFTGTIPFGYCDTGSSFSSSCTVTQAASAANTLSLDKSMMEFDGTGGELSGDTFTVTATPSGNYSCSDNRSWITLSKSGNTYTVTVSDNVSQANRKGTITCTHSLDSSLKSTISVTQYGDI